MEITTTLIDCYMRFYWFSHQLLEKPLMSQTNFAHNFSIMNQQVSHARLSLVPLRRALLLEHVISNMFTESQLLAGPDVLTVEQG